MSDNVRVMFKIPQNHPKWSKVANPVEIPLEKYVEFRLNEREGDKDYMVSYVSKNFLGGKDVSPDELEMVTAAGNDMIIYEIDSQIEQGINPLENQEDDYADVSYGSDHGDAREERYGMHRQHRRIHSNENDGAQKWYESETVKYIILLVFGILLMSLGSLL